MIERYQNWREVREANKKLAALVLSWVTDQPLTEEEFMETFEAAGHSSEYHENPKDTTFKRVSVQLTELPNIIKRIADTPLGYMGAVELSYVYQRIQQMIQILEEIPEGSMQQAIDLYKSAGDTIRSKVYTEMGHWPEEFPVPRGRITGEESEHLFRSTDYQPPLFGGE